MKRVCIWGQLYIEMVKMPAQHIHVKLGDGAS